MLCSKGRLTHWTLFWSLQVQFRVYCVHFALITVYREMTYPLCIVKEHYDSIFRISSFVTFVLWLPHILLPHYLPQYSFIIFVLDNCHLESLKWSFKKSLYLPVKLPFLMFVLCFPSGTMFLLLNGLFLAFHVVPFCWCYILSVCVCLKKKIISFLKFFYGYRILKRCIFFLLLLERYFPLCFAFIVSNEWTALIHVFVSLYIISFFLWMHL